MQIRQIYMVSFSPTGHTRNVARYCAARLVERLAVPVHEISFDLPEDRKKVYTFGPQDLVIAAGPTYAENCPIKYCRLIQRISAGRERGRGDRDLWQPVFRQFSGGVV